MFYFHRLEIGKEFLTDVSFGKDGNLKVSKIEFTEKNKKSEMTEKKMDLIIKNLSEDKLKSLWNILVKIPHRDKISEVFGEGKLNKEAIKDITEGEISFEDIKHLTVGEISKKIRTQIEIKK